VLELKTFTAQILRLNLIQIAWKIKDTDENIANFRFILGRSNSPGGPFDDITGQLINIFQFFDKHTQMKSNWRKVYYQLRVLDVRSGSEVLSEVVGLDAPPDFFLLEIRRRNDLYLRRFVGIRAAILVAKSFGQKCPECWDQIQQRVRKSSCNRCFGSGYLGGFFPQVNAFVNFSPAPELVQIADLGERQPHQTDVWLSNFPELSPRDIIVEFPEQRRWRVVSVGRTQRLRATSRQLARVVEVNRNDIEWTFPVEEFVPPEDPFLGFFPSNGSGLL